MDAEDIDSPQSGCRLGRFYSSRGTGRGEPLAKIDPEHEGRIQAHIKRVEAEQAALKQRS
jgi:hypothetical protein